MPIDPARAASMEQFVNWLDDIPAEQLRNWIKDAYWKGHLEDSELLRFFRLSLKGVDRARPLEDTNVTGGG